MMGHGGLSSKPLIYTQAAPVLRNVFHFFGNGSSPLLWWLLASSHSNSSVNSKKPRSLLLALLPPAWWRWWRGTSRLASDSLNPVSSRRHFLLPLHSRPQGLLPALRPLAPTPQPGISFSHLPSREDSSCGSLCSASPVTTLPSALCLPEMC